MLDVQVSRVLNRSWAIIRSMTLAERIEEIMKAKGLNQAQLARALKVERSAVNQWLDGSTKTLRGDIVLSLSELSGYTPRWIESGKGTRLIDKALSLGDSGRADIDSDLLRDAIIGVDAYLKEMYGKAAIPPEKRAGLIVMIYERYLRVGRVEPAEARRYLKLVG